MKELLGVIVPFALLLACSVAAVELFHDRELFVSPPDAVAEGFIREVTTKRWDRARAYLADPHSVSRRQLERLQSRLGEGENVEARTTARDDARASVEVTVGEKTLTVPMVWTKEWRVGAARR